MGQHNGMLHIVEPECRGFSHAEINAAYLAAFTLAFPCQNIVFYAEEGHLQRVTGILKSDGQGATVLPVSVTTPNPLQPSFRRFPLDLALLRGIFRAAVRSGSERVVLLSVTGSNLIATKLLLLAYRRIRCTVIVHGILEQIAVRPALRPAKWIDLPFWFRIALPWMNSRRICYVMLGGSIRRNVLRLIPRMRRFVRSVHLPYRMAPMTGEVGALGTRIRFGHFGIASRVKGAGDMIRLLEDIRDARMAEASEFHIIGHVKELDLRERLDTFGVVLPPLEPLSEESYRDRARRIDYAVFFYPVDSYRFTASAAFLDALSHLKPVIALENDYFRYCFDILGDIGYLCADYSTLRRKIVGLIKEPEPEKYRMQRRTIAEKRGCFSIEGVARDLAGLWSGRKDGLQS